MAETTGSPDEIVRAHLRELYEEEAFEVGIGLARAAKAREDACPEVAALFEEIALDEARHLAMVARLLYPQYVERGVRANLEGLRGGDADAVERETPDGRGLP